MLILRTSLLLGSLLLVSCVEPQASYTWQEPAGFEPIPVPADNPMSQDKVALGHQLYYDARLSGDGQRSCYGCHVVEHGLTDGEALALGAFDKPLTRSAPTMWNLAYHDSLYWDGRAASLEAQVLGAWKGANMGADPDSIVAALDRIPAYRDQFQKVFGGGASVGGVQQALAAYMRTLLCGTTAFDLWQQGDATAMSEAAIRGWELFRGKAACGTCHAGALFTDLRYHNVGVGMDAASIDPGRGKISGRPADTGAFKTPTLRDIARTAPYFHNGQAATLREAIRYMASGGLENEWLDRTNLKPVELSEAEIDDLVAFFEALSCDSSTIRAPQLPTAD
jgi:cytochrome c peroxidase